MKLNLVRFAAMFVYDTLYQNVKPGLRLATHMCLTVHTFKSIDLFFYIYFFLLSTTSSSIVFALSCSIKL